MFCGVAVSFHLPYWVSAVSVVLSGALAPFFLPRLPRLVRRGADEDKQQAKFACQRSA